MIYSSFKEKCLQHTILKTVSGILLQRRLIVKEYNEHFVSWITLNKKVLYPACENVPPITRRGRALLAIVVPQLRPGLETGDHRILNIVMDPLKATWRPDQRNSYKGSLISLSQFNCKMFIILSKMMFDIRFNLDLCIFKK